MRPLRVRKLLAKNESPNPPGALGREKLHAEIGLAYYLDILRPSCPTTPVLESEQSNILL